MNGRWTCAAKPTATHIAGTSNICPDDQIYSTCVSDCPFTCENKDSPTPTCNTTVCKEGCECKPGYVKLGKKCVLKDDCPCFHAGVAYKEGQTFTMDCNEWFV